MDTAFDILGITGPIYLAIALGYFATRRAWFSKADMPVFGRFTIQIALPALLFNALSQRSAAEVFNLQYLGAYALGSLLVIGLGPWWAHRVQGHSPSYSSMMAMGMACPNSGFVGYPIMLLTLGAPVAGVALALNMVVENLLLIPVLLAVADSEGGQAGHWRQVLRQTLLGLLRNPMIWGIVGGFLVSLSGLHMPEPVSRTVDLFSAASGALSLFVIGGSLVGLKPDGLKGTIAQIAFGKLIVHPLVMLVVLSLIDVVMISNLLIMVIIGGYETFVSRLELEGHPDQPEWLSHVNANILKVKLATAIIGISSIHLLKTFISADSMSDKALLWQTIIHVTFILSAVAIAYIDRLLNQSIAAEKH